MTGLPGTAEPLAASLVRLTSDGALLGTGFVLPGDLVATCAHVVPEDGPVTAEFPLLANGTSELELVARDTAGDVAVLRLLDPPRGALPAPVRLDADVLGHRFRVPGFTAAEPHGVWVSGSLAGVQGEGRVQMAVDPHHERIAPGFSGGPVWDEELHGVVGMVVTKSGNSTAHLVPVSFLAQWTDSGRNPYLGLAPFRQADAALFHGRHREVAELRELLARQDLVAIAGPSGSGKSSLVRAGLLPELAGTVVEVRPEDPLPDAESGTVLFLDQFEEQVVADPDAARARLAQIIELIAAQPVEIGRPAPVRAVLTLRSRSLDELITAATAKKLNQAVWLLEPMDRDGLREAIVRPVAEVGGLAFEVGLVEAIQHDAPPGHGALPLLSEVLKQLWDHRRGGWLTHAAYEELGRLPGALSKHADAALATLRPDAAEQAKRLLIRLTRPDGEGGHARRGADLAELEPQLREIAHDLAATRLVVIREQHVELPHQALIDHWPTLRNWLTEDADFLSWQAKLHDLQASGVQLTGAPLAEATDWLHRRGDDIPTAQRDFITHSEATRRRTQRRWRTITTISIALALVALLLTGAVATYAARTSDQLRTTNAAQLAQAAQRATEIDPRQSLQLAQAAYREKPESQEARAALFQQRLYWHGVERIIPHDLLPDPSTWSILSSTDGQVVVIYPGDWSKAPSVWWGLDGPDPEHRELPVDQNVSPPANAQLSPDGRFLAVSTKDERRSLRVLDLANSDAPAELVPQGHAGEVTFSRNSRFLSSKPDDDREPVRVWDLVAGHELPGHLTFEDLPHGHNVSQVFPSPDGRSLITEEYHAAGPDGFRTVVVVRDLATGARLHTYPASTGSDDGLLVGGGTLLALCDATGLHAVEPLTGRSFAASPGLACAEVDTDLTGQYLLPTTPRSQSQQVVHWASWQRKFVTGPPLGTKSALLPREDGDLTVVDSLGGAVTVRTVPTADEDFGTRTGFTPAADGTRWAAFDEPADELVVVDASGTALASTPVPRTAESSDGWVDKSFDATGSRLALAVGPRLYVYRTEDLVLEREIQLPVPPGHSTAELTDFKRISMLRGPGGELVVSAWGMLSTWDLATGTETAPPVVVELSDPLGGLPDTATLTARPGHPGHALATSDGKLALWDLNAREPWHEFSFPTGSMSGRSPVVSPDGGYAAVTGFQAATSVFDLNALERVAEINVVDNGVVGFAGDLLITGLGSEIGVWNWRQRRSLVDAVTVLHGAGNFALDGDVFFPDARPGQREPVPMDPEVWFADLCRLSDRDFTDQERDLLPEGASRDWPCDR